MNMSKLTLPGLIDPHVHLRDPGQTHKEDFYTGTAAALAGGYTCILDMPNNTVPVTTAERLKEKMAIAKEKIVCDVGLYFGSLGNNLKEFAKVKNKVLGLKLYLNSTTGNFLFDKKLLSRVFSAWGSRLLAPRSFNEVGPILVHAEDSAVFDVLEVVRQTRHKTHFCHVTAFELKQIIKAKEEGLPITCGVTPHHLFLTEDDAKALGPYAKMRPPLFGKIDVAFLWENLRFIDVVESDHAPHTIEEKQSDNPPYGVPGLETTLPLLLTATSEGRLTIDEVIRLCHTNPAKIFGIPTDPTTKVEVEKDTKYEIRNTDLFTKCRWSPFAGFMVKGKISSVVLHGREVYKDGEILTSAGSGKIIAAAAVFAVK